MRRSVLLAFLLWGAHLSLVNGDCGGSIQITGGDSGSISPGVGPYSGACIWEIRPSIALSDPQRLVIGVHSLDTVANYSLQVYDGNTTETLLYNYTSGNAKPGEVRARQHTFATIVFIPAATATNVSLELYWYTSVLCGASVVRLADPEGNMTSGPGPYKDGMLCDWVVAPTSIPKGYHVAFLVTMLDTHSDDAYVQINDASDFLVAKFACTNLPSAEIGCPTEYCKVYWHTTEVSPANTHRGFAMRYYLSDGPVTPSGLHLTIYILMGISSGLFLFFLTCCSFRYWRKHPKCSSHWWWDCCVDSCCDTLCPCCQPVCRQKPPRSWETDGSPSPAGSRPAGLAPADAYS